MQEHLCRTLAHFIIYLSSHLGLQLSRSAEQELLAASPTNWRKLCQRAEEWRKGEAAALKRPKERHPRVLDSSFDAGLTSKSQVWFLGNHGNLRSGDSEELSFFEDDNTWENPIPNPTHFGAWISFDMAGHDTMFGHSTTMDAEEMNLPLPVDEGLWSAVNIPEAEMMDPTQNSDCFAFDFEDVLDTSQESARPTTYTQQAQAPNIFSLDEFPELSRGSIPNSSKYQPEFREMLSRGANEVSRLLDPTETRAVPILGHRTARIENYNYRAGGNIPIVWNNPQEEASQDSSNRNKDAVLEYSRTLRKVSAWRQISKSIIINSSLEGC
jgi:hypothetical protein